METIESKQLSSEFQELHNENKEWLADVLFMEDEIRFYKKLFDKVITAALHENRVMELSPLSTKLDQLDHKKEALKLLITKNQHLIESIIKDAEKAVGIEVIEENTEITREIKLLFLEERAIRKALFSISESIFDEENKKHLLSQ